MRKEIYKELGDEFDDFDKDSCDERYVFNTLHDITS
jgi:hypothetical protein